MELFLCNFINFKFLTMNTQVRTSTVKGMQMSNVTIFKKKHFVCQSISLYNTN